VITYIEEEVENSKVTLGAFLDIEGAFDSTSFDIITKAAKWHGLGHTICRWIASMLGSRKITATLATETLEGSVARGCPQGDILSPLLWSLDVDELTRLNGNGYYTLGQGSSHPLIGPEPARGISAKVARGVNRDWTSRKHEERWQSI
jgi:hypothetical protein